MIQAYRYHGHRYAQMNPLKKAEVDQGEEINLAQFGLDDSNLDDIFATAGVLSQSHAKLSEILKALKRTYTNTVAIQLGEIASLEERRWLREIMEACQNHPDFTEKEKQRIYNALYKANAFEKYLHNKFTGMKRFSIEGGDALIPMLETLIHLAGKNQMSDIVLGMAHRGRLNVLVNIMGKPLAEIFAAFMEKAKSADESSSGDVKYHHGKSCDIVTDSGNTVHMSLLSNPSHLEAVNPVVTGSTRAKQQRHEDGQDKVLPLLIHGDSAFAGQGVVPETLNLANLEGYTVGGTVHVVINNQVGFTANPEDTFSGEYCTDIARMLQCPIFHVNGDDPEACVHVMELAFEYRHIFKKDVVIDLVCYRRHGHNEGDDPAFTQPVMYKGIKQHKVPCDLYKQRLLNEKKVTDKNIASLEDAYNQQLQAAFAEAEKGLVIEPDIFKAAWSGFSKKSESEPDTKVSPQVLSQISDVITAYPKGFTPNKKVAKVIDQRCDMLEGKQPLNWGAGEAAAYGSLLKEGYDIRLSGQDVKRGTFSHRHIGMVDGETGQTVFPIADMAKKGTSLEVHNSCLSELAVLGFEFGHTLASPNTLTIWEAQFGDFANGAQIMMDQFISSTEIKWHRYSGLVMQLPHGSEGQGPEHSSARLERFLQLCGDDNMSVCMPSTPAQMCHVLRRQMLRKFRKPLVIMTPKSLLRHPQAVSDITEITDGSFQTVIDDASVQAKDIKRIVLCSGKIYYDLMAGREEANRKDVAIIRLEELHPLPTKELAKVLKKYKTDEICWVQEEPRNQGAWTFLLDNLWAKLGIPAPRYIGRAASASPAVGSAKRHAEEQARIVEEALG